VRLIVAVVAALMISFSRSSCAEPNGGSIRVLLVGNSLTTVGNLPGVFDALSAANGHPTSSDMIATGGATLTHWVQDGAISRALANKKYAYLILQERGGDFACGFGPQVCVDARRSLATFAKLARAHQVTPLLLGTYQAQPEGSVEIVAAESKAARAIGMDYVSVSERLRTARAALPDRPWFAADGMHPGSELTLLDALLLYERIHSERPGTVSFTLTASGNATGTRYDSERLGRLEQQLW
jgi:hypothetical protein